MSFLHKEAVYKEPTCKSVEYSNKLHISSIIEFTLFMDMLKDLNFDEGACSFIVKREINISICTTYFIFCCRNKPWKNPELLNF